MTIFDPDPSVAHELLPARRLWTREEYERVLEVGVFKPEERLELIEGEIVEMAPQKSRHFTGVCLAKTALETAFPVGYTIRIQGPLALGSWSEPEPDLAVVVGAVRDYTNQHPDIAVLILEVSDTTLAYDRSTKASLYARAGIADYWILNLVDHVLEVHRSPAPVVGQPLGYHYRHIVRYTNMQSVTPLAAPTVSIQVADLLP